MAYWRTTAGIIATAALIKLVVLAQLHDHPLLQAHGALDTAYYIELARRVASEGTWAPTGSLVVSPLYLYFLAAVFAAGLPLVAAQVFQAALGAVAVGLSFATGRHWFGHRAALMGAALVMLTGSFTFHEVLVLQSALDPFLVSWALYAVTRTQADGGWLAHAGAGISLGLLSLNRPNAVVYAAAAIAGVAVLHWMRSREHPRPHAVWPVSTGMGYAAVLAGGFAVVLGVNAARSYAASGELVMIASHGGLNLYIGNHEHADGTYTPVAGITPSVAGQAVDAQRIAEASAGRRLSQGEVSSYFASQAIEWATEHPGDAVRLTIRKIAILLNAVDVPLNYSLPFYAQEPGSLLRWLAVGPWLLLPFGLVGLVWRDLRVSGRGYWLWAMFVPVYGAAVVLFFVADRYRMPLLVPLAATAGAALIRIVDLARARRVLALAGPAAALALLALVVFADRGLENGLGGEQTRKAVFLVEQGAIDEARRYVADILPAHSHPGVLQFRVGQALSDAGRSGDAVPFFEGALSRDGPQPAILLALVRTLVLTGRAADAVRRLPDIPDTVAVGESGVERALDFGTLALEHGVTSEALRWTGLAVAGAPGRAEAHEKLGVAHLLAGNADGAVPHLERACELDRGSASARLNLAAAYASLGRHADARRLATEALRLDPSEPRAAALLAALPQ